jgi:catechol 2,3-dioxygenase-like lactoylglutathione lyase family enzyme
MTGNHHVSGDAPVRILGVDHLVFVVPDVPAVARWWHDLFGVEVLRLDAWRRREVLFVSLRVSPTTIIDLVAGEPSGTNVHHLSLWVDPGVDLHELARSGRVEVDHDPFVIWGAQGDGLAMYIRDPVGNRIELKQYGPTLRA